MSSTAQKTVNTAGYGFAFILLLLVFIIAVLFLIPGSSLFGVSSVEGRQSYTTYSAATNSDVADLLTCRNIIIESRSIDVEIRVRKAGQLDEGSIQVWDNSSGLTFNSIKRTQIEWEQVIIENELGVGEVFYKLIISEPSGIISRNARVYINYQMNVMASSQADAYNFVLNTGSGNVYFTSDNIADENYTYYWLNVGTITVGNSTGKISFPKPKKAHDFYVNVGNIVVKGDNANVDNDGATVEGDVEVSGDNVKLSLGDVEGDLNIDAKSGTISVGAVNGNVNIKGNISFTQRGGVVSGNVEFRGDSGKVDINGCDELFVETKNAVVNVRQKCSRVTFTATENGKIYVGQIGDSVRLASLGSYTEDTPYDSTIKVRWGSVDLRNVWCDVSVDMGDGSAGLRVDFASAIDIVSGTRFPRLKTRAYDSVSTVNNICGEIDMFIRANGKGTVAADFRQVYGSSNIKYEGSTRPSTTSGNVKVTFVVNIAYCFLVVEHNASGRNYGANVVTAPNNDVVSSNGGVLENNGSIYHVNKDGGSVTGTLTVNTSNSLSVYSRAA